MKTLFALLLSFTFFTGCATSQQNVDMQTMDIPNLIEAKAAPSSDFTRKNVYVDSAEIFRSGGTHFILVKGHLPTPCSNLDEVSHSISQGRITLSMNAWEEAGTMCMQVLEPFSYLHRLGSDVNVSTLRSAVINGTIYALQ
jgi:hypothetical protein